jgi:hypothetical protein
MLLLLPETVPLSVTLPVLVAVELFTERLCERARSWVRVRVVPAPASSFTFVVLVPESRPNEPEKVTAVRELSAGAVTEIEPTV